MPSFFAPVAQFFQTVFAGITNKIVTGTTEASIVPTGVGALTIPANTLKQGTVMRLLLAGPLTTPLVSFGNATVKMKLNGVVITTAATTSLLGNLSGNGEFTLSQTIQCTAVGVAGKINVSGRSKYPSGTLGNRGEAMMAVKDATVDTTINQTIDVTVQWGLTGHSVDILTATIEMLQP